MKVEYHDEPLLCSIASRLTLHGPSFEYQGEPSRTTTPASRAYSTALALCHAHERSPIGWAVFEVKYLERTGTQGTLLTHVVNYLPDSVHQRRLGKWVCQVFCTGAPVSRRALRRELGVDRVTAGRYYEDIRRTLYWLRVTEQEFTTLIRKGLWKLP